MVPNEDVAILVVSWDGYQDVWEPFFHCFFKYWPDCPYPIYLGSNRLTYDDPRVRGIRIGADKNYSSNLIAMLEQLACEWVVLWIDDALLSGPVNTARVSSLIAAAQEKNAAYLKLFVTPFSLTSLVVPETAADFCEVPKGAPYRVSMTVGLWRKRALLDFLRPGESAWDIERNGSLRSCELVEPFLCVSKGNVSEPPLPLIHGIWQRRWTWEAAQFLRQEGLQECLKGRPVQSYRSFLQKAAYMRIRYLFFGLLNRFVGSSYLAQIVRNRR